MLRVDISRILVQVNIFERTIFILTTLESKFNPFLFSQSELVLLNTYSD